MLAFLNGKFVPEQEARVSIFDRSFLYGDGLFETILVSNGKPFRWQQHVDRLRNGAAFIKIEPPFSDPSLRATTLRLIRENRVPEGLLRITLSRGVGLRGYSTQGADNPTLAISLHPSPGAASCKVPLQWQLVTSSLHLPAHEALALFKTCNKLPQILARAEAEARGADEALLMNTDGFVVEGASSNLFWIEGSTLCTPPLASGILAGVTRDVVREVGARMGVSVEEKNATITELCSSAGVFMSLSSLGVVEARSVDGRELNRSPLVEKLGLAFWTAVREETA